MSQHPSPPARPGSLFEAGKHAEDPLGGLPVAVAVLVEACARRVVELLDERAAAASASSRLVSAAELALELGVSRSFVYEHAAELGAISLGSGARPRLRFDVYAAKSSSVCSSGGQSDAENVRSDGRSAPATGRRSRRLPDRLPQPGSVLQVRGERAA